MNFPIPANGAERVAAVEAYSIADTSPEAGYDDIAELAAEICSCLIGLINIIADTRECLKAKYGLPPNLACLVQRFLMQGVARLEGIRRPIGIHSALCSEMLLAAHDASVCQTATTDRIN